MREKSIDVFIGELKTGAPVPGGGGASALMGAVSAALLSMVGNLTTGKKKYAEYQADIDRILEHTSVLAEEMSALIEADAEAFEPLAKAYSIPKDDPNREETLEAALLTAAKAPMDIVRKCVEAADIVEELSVKGSKLAISDVGVAAAALKAAAEGAVMNVYINTKLMHNREIAAEMNTEAKAAVNAVSEKCTAAYNKVKSELLGE